MAMPRLVLDTNTVLSALLFSNGRLGWLRRAWQARQFVPLVSRATADELIRVLAYPKFKLTSADREDLLADYLPYCEIVAVATSMELPECRDAADLPFLSLAMSGNVDALVSGDSDLLVLSESFMIPIIPPGELPQRFAQFKP